jgi:hypothetical protein
VKAREPDHALLVAQYHGAQGPRLPCRVSEYLATTYADPLIVPGKLVRHCECSELTNVSAIIGQARIEQGTREQDQIETWPLDHMRHDVPKDVNLMRTPQP